MQEFTASLYFKTAETLGIFYTYQLFCEYESGGVDIGLYGLFLKPTPPFLFSPQFFFLDI